MARVVLIGLPGVGKSTVARALAERWRTDVLDTDEQIAAIVGESASQYLRSHGEAAFREVELEALRSALESDVVLACGGGVVTTQRGRELLAGQRTVWLDCPDDVIVTRLRDGDRPLIGEDPDAGVARLREERARLYEEVASCRVDSSGAPDEVVDRVIAAFNRVSS